MTGNIKQTSGLSTSLGAFVVAIALSAAPAGAQISVDTDASDGDVGASVGGVSASVGSNDDGDGVSASADVRGGSDRDGSGLSADADGEVDLSDPSAAARVRLGAGRTSVLGTSTSDLSDPRSNTRLRLGTPAGAGGNATVDINGTDDESTSARIGVGLGLGEDGGGDGGTTPGGGSGLPPGAGGLPPGGGAGDGGTGGLPSLETVTSLDELGPAIDRMAPGERLALQTECSAVLASPAGFDAALVSLCRLALRIM